jgi:hypothetical protein
MKLFAVVLLTLIGLVDCSGGSSMATLPQSSGPLTPSGNLTQPPSESPDEGVRRPEPQYTPSTADLLYVGNVGNNSITVYRHDAQGNAAPIKVIAGPKTGISVPGQLSEDAQGNLYVANGSYGVFATGTQPGVSLSASPGILVFAHGASGNVAPIRKLAGPATGIHNVAAVTVDKATGKIFVVDFEVYPTCASGLCVSILRFPPNANGNTPPFARSPADAFPAWQLDSDSTGKNLISAHDIRNGDPEYSFTAGIQTLAKQFYDGADPTSPYQLSAFYGTSVADDPTTRTYWSIGGEPLQSGGSLNGIFRFDEDTSGHFAEGSFVPAKLAPPVVSVLTSETCGTQLALGYLRNIYVTHNQHVCASNDAVYVYAHDASGNASPLRVLSGPATRLDEAWGIYEGQ